MSGRRLTVLLSALWVAACGHAAPRSGPSSHAAPAQALPACPSQASSRADRPRCLLQQGDGAPQLAFWVHAGCPRIVTAAGAEVKLASPHVLTIPASVTVAFEQGATWKLEAGSELALLGKVETTVARARIFTGEGSVSSPGSYDGQTCERTMRVAYPEWFGARVDDGADDSLAIARALLLGDTVELAPGTYDLKHRLVLARNQTLEGAGVGVTRLSQLPDAALVRHPESDAPDDPALQSWVDFRLQDFIVGLASDCASVRDLTISGERLPDNLHALSNMYEKRKVDPLVSGIQISSHLGWKPGIPPIHDVRVKAVDIDRPASNCIDIQSDRAARDVLIEDMTCTARDSRPNTSGLTIEAFHPTYANHFENITVRRSRFRGGSWGLYIAGVRNFVLEDSSVEVGANAYSAVLLYTSDNGHPITATIRNSTFALPTPGSVTRAVLELAGRGYAKDRESVFPYLVPTESSLVFEGGSIASATYPAPKLVPLVLDNVGFAEPVEFRATRFVGGSHAILAADPQKPRGFGARVFEANAVPGAPTILRDLTPAEIRKHKVRHSTFHLSDCQFEGQAESPIKLTWANLSLVAPRFSDTLKSPSARRAPQVALGVHARALRVPAKASSSPH